jgi:hypothetical protein
MEGAGQTSVDGCLWTERAEWMEPDGRKLTDVDIHWTKGDGRRTEWGRMSMDIEQNGMNINGRQPERGRTSDETRTDIGRNKDGHRMEWGWTSDGVGTDVKRNGDGTSEGMTMRFNGTDGNYNKLRWRYKAIHVRELYGDGMQKRKDFLFLLLHLLLLLLFSSYFSSRAVTRVTYYMTTSSKIHKNA